MADTNVSDTETMAELKDGWGDIDDIRRNFQKAVDEAIAEHRRHGRPIVVDRGNGVDVSP